MLTKEDLALLSQMLDEKLEEKLEAKLEEKLETKLEEKLDKKLDEKLAPIYLELKEIKEEAVITRGSLNSVIEWIETYFKDEYPLPVK